MNRDYKHLKVSLKIHLLKMMAKRIVRLKDELKEAQEEWAALLDQIIDTEEYKNGFVSQNEA